MILDPEHTSELMQNPLRLLVVQKVAKLETQCSALVSKLGVAITRADASLQAQLETQSWQIQTEKRARDSESSALELADRLYQQDRSLEHWESMSRQKEERIMVRLPGFLGFIYTDTLPSQRKFMSLQMSSWDCI